MNAIKKIQFSWILFITFFFFVNPLQSKSIIVNKESQCINRNSKYKNRLKKTIAKYNKKKAKKKPASFWLFVTSGIILSAILIFNAPVIALMLPLMTFFLGLGGYSLSKKNSELAEKILDIALVLNIGLIAIVGFGLFLGSVVD
jgi:hypothetical protein